MNAEGIYDAVVIGAGVVGASSAWHLAQAGLSVALVDAEGPAAAASGASDGAVSVASKKPGPLARLATASLLYTRDLAQGGPLSSAYHPRPSYIFGTGSAESAAIDALIAKLAQLGTAVRLRADGDATLLPGVGTGIDRVVALEGEGHMPGYAAVQGYLREPRIDRFWPAPVTALEESGSEVRIVLGTQTLRAKRVIAALGTATPRLFPTLPVLPRAGQLFVTDRGLAGQLPGALTSAAYLLAKTTAPSVLPKPPVVIDPLATGQYLIGSTREDHGDPTRVDFETLRELMLRAVEAWPALRARRVIRAFAGVRAAVSDGLPIVGSAPGYERVLLATGFEGDGICLSAVIGREAARMTAGLSPDAALAADFAALSPARFAQVQEGAA
ncbi:FAD-binding oxidoreductase [Sinirhodobacter sp. WL0062]|uniref:FAD-binding oxidoreductase n=1 Tax=Rhodobacter flavimaris TaxID=2907145 RepID=A0ABS8YYR9_9RHOB|nr:FAD-dependent oxidoreductase [Sinirhodobacter sp. WL0062]MCE5974969.1 FAD-binding oxidoreductase [Sinirhodobacter sp. WL0062]